MKEQGLDIGLVLKSINGKIDELTKQLDVANRRIEFLEKENAVLKRTIGFFTKTPKDSHNSSIPPSKDSLVA